jgi:hypothetical protein
MEQNFLSVALRSRETRPDGQFLQLNDPDDLVLHVLGELLPEYPLDTVIRILCPSYPSDPNAYSYSWYLKYPDRTFVFEGRAAAHFENAAKAARARQGEWF